MREARHEKLSERLSHGAPLAAIVLVVSGVSLFLIYKLLPILELIAIAMLLALVLRTIVRGLERVRFPIWLSVIVLLVLLGALAVLVWLVIIPSLLEQFRQLTSSGSGSLQSVAKLLNDLPLVPNLSKLSDQLRGYLSGLVNSLPRLVYGVVEVLAALIAITFLALYFAAKPDTYVRGILRMVPVERRPGVQEFIERVGERLRGWIVGVILVATFIGLGSGLGLWLLGVPLALTFGIIAGVLNVIPFAGSIVGGALPAILALTISPVKAVEVVVLFVALNQIEAHILQPQIMGREVKISTAMVIVAFLVLGTLLGPIIGAFLAIPATVVVGVIIDELAENEPSLGFEEDHRKRDEARKEEIEEAGKGKRESQ